MIDFLLASRGPVSLGGPPAISAGEFIRAAAWFAEVALFAASLIYIALAVRFTVRFRGAQGPSPARAPGLSVLKPLCGPEPELDRMLASLMSQQYPGPLQVIFCARGEDGALDLARRTAARFPDVEAVFVRSPDARGANPKVINLMGAEPFVRHELVAVSDSDVWLQPDALARVVQRFDDPEVGTVTCLYRGLARRSAGLLERLGALHINAWFIPSALVAAGLAPIETGYGPLTVIRRAVLEAEGGFAALAWRLADDHELGRMAVRQGLRVALSDVVVSTLTPEQTLPDMLTREVRWGRTSRATNPVGYAASVVTQPLPVLLALEAVARGGLGWPAFAVLLVSRWGLAAVAERRVGQGWTAVDWILSPFLVPLREVLCFLAWGASHFGRHINWRGRRYRICAGARLVRASERGAVPRLDPAREAADA